MDEFVARGQEENLFLDFKQVNRADLSHSDDEKNFARALSGFANSSGGLIVWGVEARKSAQGVDCAVAKAEISDARLFVARLNELTGQFVSPLVDGVVHRHLRSAGTSGLAVTLVPESDSGPHMAKAGKDRYFKRSGDSFYRMEHFDIEDMFGRRRKPVLGISATLTQGSSLQGPNRNTHEFQVFLSLTNTGRGSAAAPYMAVFASPDRYLVKRHGIAVGGQGQVFNTVADNGPPRWTRFVSDATFVVHPETRYEFALIKGDLDDTDAMAPDLEVECAVAAENFRMARFTLSIPGGDLIDVARGTSATRLCDFVRA